MEKENNNKSNIRSYLFLSLTPTIPISIDRINHQNPHNRQICGMDQLHIKFGACLSPSPSVNVMSGKIQGVFASFQPPSSCRLLGGAGHDQVVNGRHR